MVTGLLFELHGYGAMSFVWNDARAITVVTRDQERVLRPDVKVARVRELRSFGNFLKPLMAARLTVLVRVGIVRSIVPVDVEAWTLVRRPKGPPQSGAFREGGIGQGVDIECFNMGWVAGIERHENRVHGMARHVGQGATAKVEPASAS